LVTRKKWRSADFRKLAGSEKDVGTSTMNKTTYIGKTTQEEAEEVKRTEIEEKMRIKHTCTSYLLIRNT